MKDTVSSYRWVILVLALLCQVSASSVLQVVSPLAPLFQPELGISKAEVGLLSAATSIGAWAVVLLALLPVQLYCSFLLPAPKASSFIIWSGDGGAMVIGTLLMLSLYARQRSQIRVGWLRWGFLVIGAAAFADGFATWWAARTNRDAIPFGENEGRGLSDPTVLVYERGFSIPGLVSSYLWTGAICLGVLAVAYVLGLRREHDVES